MLRTTASFLCASSSTILALRASAFRWVAAFVASAARRRVSSRTCGSMGEVGVSTWGRGDNEGGRGGERGRARTELAAGAEVFAVLEQRGVVKV